MIIRRDGKSNILHGDCFNNTHIQTLVEASKLKIDENGEEVKTNAGINVGLPYNGSAPDIGFYETGTPPPASTEGFKIKMKIKFG